MISNAYATWNGSYEIIDDARDGHDNGPANMRRTADSKGCISRAATSFSTLLVGALGLVSRACASTKRNPANKLINPLHQAVERSNYATVIAIADAPAHSVS